MMQDEHQQCDCVIDEIDFVSQYHLFPDNWSFTRPFDDGMSLLNVGGKGFL